MAIVDKDINDLVDIFEDLDIHVRNQWTDDFKDDLYLALLESDQWNPEIPNPGPIDGVSQALRKYHIKVPMVTMLMLKVLLMVEADASKLYPEIDFIKEIKPLTGELVKNQLLGRLNVQKTVLNLIDTFIGMKDIPDNINSALKVISNGSFRFKFAHDDLDRLGRSIDRASYKILLGLVMAASLLGSSIVIYASQSILGQNLYYVVLAYYFLTILVGIYAAYHLIRR